MEKNLIKVGETYILQGDKVHDELVGTKVTIVAIVYDTVWFVGVRGFGVVFDTQLDSLVKE